MNDVKRSSQYIKNKNPYITNIINIEIFYHEAD